MDTDADLFINVQPPSSFSTEPPGSSLVTIDTPESERESDHHDDDDDVALELPLTGAHHHSDPTVINLDFFVYRPQPRMLECQRHDQCNTGDQGRLDRCFKCPICLQKKANFFCPSCIRNGDFTHSKKNFLERFADKKLKFINLKGQQSQISDAAKSHFHNSFIKDELNFKINELNKNLKTIARIISERKRSIKYMKSLLDNAKRDQYNCSKKQLKLKEGISHMRNQLAKQSVAINDCFQRKRDLDSEIQALITAKVNSLTVCVFPLREDSMISHQDDSTADLNDSSEELPLLDTDRLVVSDPKGDTRVSRYRIIDTWVCSNENYSQFVTQANSAEYLIIRENIFRNDYDRITSALTYLCHLTNLIAVIGNVHLPRKLLFSEFSSKVNKRDDYLSKIARLNANILFLCLYNRVDAHLLHPRQAFSNLLSLLNVPSFSGLFDTHLEISNHFFKAIQDNLLDDINLIDKDSSELIDFHDEHDYDFVESDIPDLNLATDEQTSGFSVFSLVSSLYKRTAGQK